MKTDGHEYACTTEASFTQLLFLPHTSGESSLSFLDVNHVRSVPTSPENKRGPDVPIGGLCPDAPRCCETQLLLLCPRVSVPRRQAGVPNFPLVWNCDTSQPSCRLGDFGRNSDVVINQSLITAKRSPTRRQYIAANVDVEHENTNRGPCFKENTLLYTQL